MIPYLRQNLSGGLEYFLKAFFLSLNILLALLAFVLYRSQQQPANQDYEALATVEEAEEAS